MSEPARTSTPSERDRPYSVLVVDDEANMRRIVRGALQRDGFTVLEAADGDEAWEMIPHEAVDIVISDVCMPGRSGRELLASLSEGYPDLPVILMTGEPSLEAAVACIKLGAADYISKPFELSRLRQTVQTAVAQLQRGAGGGYGMFGPGSHLAGYRILRTLGEGNVGMVFLVEDRDSEERCALKILKLAGVSGTRRDKMLKRFLVEAEAMGKVEHPNVIRFIEYGVAHGDEVPYLAMEYFPSRTLKDCMAEMGVLSYRERADIVTQIASGLTAIHAQDICHRDIKPGNIMIDLEQRAVRISDFGIAQLPDYDLTAPSNLIGTPAYMAPEAFVSSRVDPLADLFSLGGLAYELMVGFRPFDGETVQALARQIPGEVPKAPSAIDPAFPPGLQRVLAKLLKKARAERYQSAGEVVAGLQDFLDSDAGEASPGPRGLFGWMGTRRSVPWP